MAKNNVFANGREIACKSGSGKVLAHFPDVCFTPPDKVPPTPPGVPIPYPLFSKAKDTNKGTKRVMVSKKEVMKRDSSNFKKCKGDEAAKTAKKGIINGKLTGKVFFTSWSMNVKIEKKNVVRHLDTLGSNHGSTANGSAPWPFIDSMTTKQQKACKEDKKRKHALPMGYREERERNISLQMSVVKTPNVKKQETACSLLTLGQAHQTVAQEKQGITSCLILCCSQNVGTAVLMCQV